MKNFLVIYYAPTQSFEQMKQASPEERMAGMKLWMDWKASHEDKIVNFGAPVIPGQDRSANESWKDSDKDISGFSLVQGENIEEVKEMLNDHPHTAYNPACKIGVYEFFPMM